MTESPSPLQPPRLLGGSGKRLALATVWRDSSGPIDLPIASGTWLGNATEHAAGWTSRLVPSAGLLASLLVDGVVKMSFFQRNCLQADSEDSTQRAIFARQQLLMSIGSGISNIAVRDEVLGAYACMRVLVVVQPVGCG